MVGKTNAGGISVPVYNGAHHSVITNYTVTISLTNPLSSTYFSSCIIYEMPDENTQGSQIGSINSASGSVTVSVSLNSYGIWIALNGGYVVPPSEATMTGGISDYYWQDGSAGACITVSVSGDGTMTVDGIDWND